MKNNNNSNNKPKKNGRKINLPAKSKSKNKTKVKVKETIIPAHTSVYAIDDVNEHNNTSTVSTATTHTVSVNASNYDSFPSITALPNKEELYSKYTETEEETSYNNSVVPKANNDGVKTMIIIAGAFALIAFLALVLS